MRLSSGRRELFFWLPAALIAVTLVIAVFMQVKRLPTHRAPYIVGDPEKGAALFYGDKQCAICHSVDGLGGRTAPELSGTRPSTPAMGWLAAALWNHGPAMWQQIRQKSRPYPDLNSQDMADILAFLYQASSIDRHGDSGAGQQVFNGTGCSRCHSVGGIGGRAAPELSSVTGGNSNAWSRAMLNHAGSMVAPIKSTLGSWPRFSGNEMIDLIAYVNADRSQTSNNVQEVRGDPQQGWNVFQSRCMGCHSVRGRGGSVGPELGPDKELPLTLAQFASVMWNHAPAMLQEANEKRKPFADFRGQELADLLAFLASLRYFEPAGSPLVGRRVFAERGCATCHGRMAEGSKLAPRLTGDAESYTTVTFVTALWRHGPRMFERTEELGASWPTLEANDMGDIVSFLNAPASLTTTPK